MKSFSSKKTLALLLIPAATLSPLVAGAQENATELREQIQQLDQKLRILERNLELKEEAAKKSAEESAKKLPNLSIGPKGVSLSSADKAYSLKVGALVQADGRFYLDDGADNRNTFILRRVRTPFSGTIAKIFNFNVTPEFAQADATSSNNNTQLVDAWIDGRFSKAFGVKVGKFRSPVALEGNDQRHFMESTYTNQLAPNRDIGVEAFGSVAENLFAYRLGVFNGAPNNTWSGTRNGTDGDFSVAGRLTLNPFVKNDNALAGLSLSVGGSYGNEAGSTSAIRSPGQQNIVGSLTATGDHLRVAPALEWYAGPFSLVAELAYDQQEISGGNTVGNLGWRVSGGWVLTGEKSTKGGVSPEKPFSWENGTWGAFELVARVSGLDIDNDAFTTHGGSLNPATNASGAFSYGAGLNWYLNNNLQVRFDVEKTNFSGGSSSQLLAENELYAFTRVQLKF